MSRTSRALGVLAAVASIVGTTLVPSSAAAATLGTYDYLLAPTTTCANQTSYATTIDTQRTAMHCLVNYARTKSGLKPLARNSKLDWSATKKANDIVSCNSFSHTACGRSFDYWIKQSGWTGSRWGENIAWGSDNGGYSTPRTIMRSWLHSDGHRANILKSTYTQLGVGLVRARFNGYQAGIWVQHFGG
jgi:uncharacterized protein YkwD